MTVTATAVLPTTFMRLGTYDEVTVTSTGEATRRMVDLSLVLDVSGSIGSAWAAVRDASRTFVNAFDATHDRVALVTYSNRRRVIDQMPASRGFDKAQVMADIPQNLPGGSTAMVEGLYRGWDELRTVPAGSSPASASLCCSPTARRTACRPTRAARECRAALRTSDFPKNFPDPDNMTLEQPAHRRALQHERRATSSPTTRSRRPSGTARQSHAKHAVDAAAELPPGHRSAGMPTSFALQTPRSTVNGVAQNVRRGLRGSNAGAGTAIRRRSATSTTRRRNLVEIIGNAARSDMGDYRIRIYTIGMGALVRYNLGTIPETSESILMRVANDKDSPDFNPAQLEGKYYFAATAADVGPAFQALQNEIIRLSK